MNDALKRLHGALTSKHWCFKYRKPAECPKTLLDAFEKELPHIDRASWPERFAWGGAYVNGHEAFGDMKLTAPAMVEYYEPKFPLNQVAKLFPRFSQENIIFEDSDLIGAFKPPGLPCTPSREQRHHSLKAYVEKYLGKEVHMPSRLDTSAQGLVVLSKSKRMHKHLQQVFEKHSVEKYYVVEVSPAVSWQRKLVENQIAENKVHPILRKVVESGGQKATTHFKVLHPGKSDGVRTSVLLAKPTTGRTHQLRVHTSHLGHPIVGDNFYGGADAAELHLLCLRVKFFNPLLEKFTEIQLPPKFIPEWIRLDSVQRS